MIISPSDSKSHKCFRCEERDLLTTAHVPLTLITANSGTTKQPKYKGLRADVLLPACDKCRDKTRSARWLKTLLLAAAVVLAWIWLKSPYVLLVGVFVVVFFFVDSEKTVHNPVKDVPIIRELQKIGFEFSDLVSASSPTFCRIDTKELPRRLSEICAECGFDITLDDGTVFFSCDTSRGGILMAPHTADSHSDPDADPEDISELPDLDLDMEIDLDIDTDPDFDFDGGDD